MRLLRGWFGEKKTALNMWLWLDTNVYKRFHNVILPSKNGTAQLDHILVSPFGIFIVETKNYKGWIFGSEEQANWTQTLYKKKYSFQNPLKQSYRQKKVLASFLQIPESYIDVVVYFVGDCQFKTPLPSNVLNSGLGRYILGFKQQVFTEEDVIELTTILEKHVSSSTLTGRDHLQSLRERHSSTTVCPKCGNKLIQRTARKGPNTGSSFLGCSNYPRCRFTKNI